MVAVELLRMKLWLIYFPGVTFVYDYFFLLIFPSWCNRRTGKDHWFSVRSVREMQAKAQLLIQLQCGGLTWFFYGKITRVGQVLALKTISFIGKRIFKIWVQFVTKWTRQRLCWHSSYNLKIKFLILFIWILLVPCFMSYFFVIFYNMRFACLRFRCLLL